ncbi:hypothetical protein A2643_01660 [Candidatus Nomurabacteria bacterium RIFCSPHIGHO2_01_FULL_39_220]|uniref:Lcl C-terminal domain-containing protein n=1 Tax=Candidatus Nomurabacteria bacterium RIFCSPLOWO2_02_FULL_40_67 TaxID=1801787 RepID=A0A1F6Y799_9BACT|nr:MAG: hypothetical protein UU01_C0006G0003 [Parcubacteria group bacterium GW2011_GWA2_40_37]OGI62173.1 MAG: hypothetical protein A2W12_01065 [Candidatus Nomurabacteria bacterium RBG_16_40_11]OGI70536.1 MAG: hypothetical protein A2643_01660 [Candidatus Nomurabacteria bacterium RIFCSPHIGHO2_01_FULL_39_220]OGI71982.1 MAG: hypothetical protein A2W56_03050 [Candidatus Nomurabacteria bacterium RIFCSPHIGHO2_02_41_18]OGI79005.1 MAG: hypothetical protein A3C65_01210 [Candidatus Nomurabacteria bacteriu
MKNKKNLTGIGIVLIIITILAVGGVVYAGTITPPSGTPAAQFYTLSEIYNFITSNTTATEGGHGFTFSDSLEGTGRTLTEIYSSLASLISADKVKSGTTYLNVAGSLVPNGGTATAAGLFNGLTAHLTGDWDLDTGTLDLACNTATFDGAGNLVATSYDGSGDGTNRFCMTASGDAVAGDLLTGLVAWVDGIALTGTMPDKEGDSASTAQSAAGGVNYFTAPTGFYDGDDRVSATDAEVATLDADVAAANILSGTTIFGVAGSASSGVSLANMYNGTSGAFTGGSQANGGADDYNNGGAAASGRYTGTWTACNAGNSYCGTSDSGADAKDDSTGLIWSLPCNGSGCATFSDSSVLTYSWDGTTDADNNSRTASQLCSDHAGWSLPHQKQLMQAYIDGSYGNLETAGVFRYHWSASTVSYTATSAWATYLSAGYTSSTNKTNSNYVRCVRLAP